MSDSDTMQVNRIVKIRNMSNGDYKSLKAIKNMSDCDHKRSNSD